MRTERQKAAYRKWLENNREKERERRRQYVKANPEKIKAYATSESRKQYFREYYQRNKVALAEKNKRWRGEKGELTRAYLAEYRARKLQATPKWARDEWSVFVIREAHALAVIRNRTTGSKWEVDHVIPLQGKKVSGLHVWNNIQVIPRTVNRRKSNKH